MTGVLKFDPTPMTSGQTAKLTGPPGTVVQLTWKPNSVNGPTELVLDENGEATFTCPTGTGAVIAEADDCYPGVSTFGP